MMSFLGTLFSPVVAFTTNTNVGILTAPITPIVVGVGSACAVGASLIYAYKKFEEREANSIVLERAPNTLPQADAILDLSEDTPFESEFDPDASLISRQEAIRSRRARVAKKAQSSLRSQGEALAAVSTPRHLPSRLFGNKDAIRVRKDEYWDGCESMSEERIQESMRDATSYVDEASDYVASIVIRGTDDSIVQKRMRVGESETILAPQAAAPQKAELEERIRSRAVAAAIANRVAFIDEGMFPERRSLDELEHRDDWELALSAMDEKISLREPIVVSVPVVATESDDSESTDFLLYGSGHPTPEGENPIDRMIGEEFARSSSASVRKTSRNFLRLYEGGSSRAKSSQGKHFSPAIEA